MKSHGRGLIFKYFFTFKTFISYHILILASNILNYEIFHIQRLRMLTSKPLDVVLYHLTEEILEKLIFVNGWIRVREIRECVENDNFPANIIRRLVGSLLVPAKNQI